MNKDISAAMLGDHEAEKQRIEEAQAQARLAWNTRAPILTSIEIDMLEGIEDGTVPCDNT